MNLIWDSESKSIRGSFVNLIITIAILFIICYACFDAKVAENVNKLTSLIIGFFTVSFGVWKAAGVIENLNTPKQ
jgi:hypothetical protein